MLAESSFHLFQLETLRAVTTRAALAELLYGRGTEVGKNGTDLTSDILLSEESSVILQRQKSNGKEERSSPNQKRAETPLEFGTDGKAFHFHGPMPVPGPEHSHCHQAE
jgi:hypothetical protein